MLKRFGLLVFLIALTAMARADKVIMKDGKIYEGHIMGESRDAVLISNPPVDPRPRFIQMSDVMTIVRERRPAEKPSSEEGRFVNVSMGLSGQFYSSDTFPFSPAAGLYGGAGFRVHPALELGGEMVYIPALSGAEVGVGVKGSGSDVSRSYEHFYAFHGGFSAKIFPFFFKTRWRAEPYLTSGYHWNRLVPNDSGDEFKGTSVFGGAGVQIPWWKPLYWDFRFVYDHTNYDSIHFLGADGDLSGVTHNSYEFSAGLSYRFL